MVVQRGFYSYTEAVLHYLRLGLFGLDGLRLSGELEEEGHSLEVVAQDSPLPVDQAFLIPSSILMMSVEELLVRLSTLLTSRR